MVKLSTRQIRSMRRELLKTTQAVKKTQQDAAAVVEEFASQLTVQKKTNSILRNSLKNFSGPLYKLKRRYNKLARAYERKSNENGHLKRGILQLNALRKRRRGKTRCIDI